MRVLIVDDHQLFADGLMLVLEDLEEKVVCTIAASAEAALEILDQEVVFDLYVVDLHLPGIDGVSLVNSLSERASTIPVVVISATENAEEVKAVIDQGARGFIPKSFNREEIHTGLKEVLSGSVFLPVNIKQKIQRIEQSVTSFPDMESNITSFGITKRQYQVLEYVAKGYSNKEVANSMFLTEHTIKVHLKALFKAMDVKNRTQLIQKAQEKLVLP
jgi:DNA-binding NarL/FixJ family response regulator